MLTSLLILLVATITTAHATADSGGCEELLFICEAKHTNYLTFPFSDAVDEKKYWLPCDHFRGTDFTALCNYLLFGKWPEVDGDQTKSTASTLPAEQRAYPLSSTPDPPSFTIPLGYIREGESLISPRDFAPASDLLSLDT